MTVKTYDIVVIGGGVMGSAAAYHLIAADRTLAIAVVERDPAYERASSTLSMANVRTQFSLAENIRISQYALEVLASFESDMTVNDQRPHIAFRQEGNLFLVNEKGRRAARQALALQQALGCEVHWWEPHAIGAHYPLYQARDYCGGTFGARDGHFDAYAVLMGYKRKARHLGVEYVHDTVLAVRTAQKRAEGVTLAAGGLLRAGVVINCAGAWCSEVALTAGIRLPVQPVRRQVFAATPAVKPPGPLPLTILPSGLYFRTESGGLILIGKSMPEDLVGFDFSWDDKRFMEILWPELWEFVPDFDRLKLLRGWAGLYAVNTLDGNAILGEWPELQGFYLANGFSGHGLQQAPAVGRYLAELILQREPALDLSIFSPERVLTGRPVSEQGLV